MKTLVLLLLPLFAAGCASQSVSSGHQVSAGGSPHYDCYTYVGSNHVLTLPIPESDAATQFVNIVFQGDRIPAIYSRDGLTQLWVLDESLYIQVDPDFVARYMDFRGAEEGERRKAEAVFECKKRK